MTGNRDRNKREKSERIFSAAAELFTEFGFAAVSTQQIAERADVAAGTVFRYASSKGELLLMVMNEEFRAGIAEGQLRCAAEPDPAAAILAMIVPILERSARGAENSHVYQRELMFGPDGERFRTAGLGLVDTLVAAIAERLDTALRVLGRTPDAAAVTHAADAVFALTHLAVTRVAGGTRSAEQAVAALRTQITQIVDGVCAGDPTVLS